MPFKNPHPLYSVWQSMKGRCTYPSNPQWADYGGRGITICDRWLGPQGFKNFVADMGIRPDGYTLDRRDNDGHYTPENCRWATRSEQQLNQRTTRKVTIEGRQYIAAELAKHAGLKTDTIIARATQGLSLAAVMAPERRVFTDGLALGGLSNGRRQQSKTHCPQGHSYDEANTGYTPKGWRYCKACKNNRQQARYARKKAPTFRKGPKISRL